MSRHGRSYRNQRDYRKAMAEETVQVLQQGWYLGSESYEPVDIQQELDAAKEASEELEENAVLARPGKGQDASMQLEVTEETSLQALYRLAATSGGLLPPMLLLNFASAKNPGGGFLGGAQAQEESLARSSGLFPCLEQFLDGMYARNRRDPRGCLYSGDMIYSPKVPFFRTDDGTFLERPVLCDVLTAPAPNRGAANEAAKDVSAILKARILRVLQVAKAYKMQTLILGAWGCGVFRNDPLEVASLFKEALQMPDFQGCFGRVVFPIPDPKMKEQFAGVLRPGRTLEPSSANADTVDAAEASGSQTAAPKTSPRRRWKGGGCSDSVAAAGKESPVENPA
mmetsp:Transcript_32795/g.73567  ORF Transcript_32795/g.73567 Transcript_32795/m.73567 type:complete len:340 (+) Transcript_32795:17-1036(+)